MMKQNKSLPLYIPVTFLLLFLSALIIRSAIAADDVTYLQSYCSKDQQYDQGSQYQNNLDLVLANLTSEAITQKFYNFSTGESPYKVYGLYLCNSVYTSQKCQDCITLAQGEIQQRCPSSIDAIVWYTECMLRYANHSIYSVNDISVFYSPQTGPVEYGEFNQQLTNTFISLFIQATTGNSSLKAATTVVSVARDISLSCYVDCTPDLKPSDCNRCLTTALGRLQIRGYQVGVLLQPSCRLLYAFNDVGLPSPGKTLYAALGVISAVAAASLFLNIFVCFKRKKTIRKPTGIEEIERMENLHFEFDTIKAATNEFSPANKLGQGGFGVVYMGTLADQQAVAVKRLSNASGQGIREFKTEACLAAKLQHRNLVKLFGFCLERDEMLLVYEFVPNKSLDRFLFDGRRGAYLKWETRYNIIVGIARGLLYLHEDSRPKIIHRDLKPSNILLDGEMNPKIADFGMAKLFGGDQTQGNTSKVAGTFGYMAPEYATTGRFSVKSDIFSYGVILLEVVSGQRNNLFDPDKETDNLLNYAWRLWDEGTPLKLLDSALGNDISQGEAERCIQVGLLCIQEDPAIRPDIDINLLLSCRCLRTNLLLSRNLYPLQLSLSVQEQEIKEAHIKVAHKQKVISRTYLLGDGLMAWNIEAYSHTTVINISGNEVKKPLQIGMVLQIIAQDVSLSCAIQ